MSEREGEVVELGKLLTCRINLPIRQEADAGLRTVDRERNRTGWR